MQNVSEKTVKELVDVLENIIIFGLSKDYLLRAKAVIAEVRGETSGEDVQEWWNRNSKTSTS